MCVTVCGHVAMTHSCPCLMHPYPGSKSKTLVLYPLRERDRQRQTGSSRETERAKTKSEGVERGDERRGAKVRTQEMTGTDACKGERGKRR